MNPAKDRVLVPFRFVDVKFELSSARAKPQTAFGRAWNIFASNESKINPKKESRWVKLLQ